VPKPFNPRELVARIRAVLRRLEPREAERQVVGMDDVRLDPASRSVVRDGTSIELTTVEFDILRALQPPSDRPSTASSSHARSSRVRPSPPSWETTAKGSAQQVWVVRDGAPAAVPVTVGETDGRRTAIVEGKILEGTPVVADVNGASPSSPWRGTGRRR
jgi:multidrug efflux pump subunit AcrA (membrane-fusion protein)